MTIVLIRYNFLTVQVSKLCYSKSSGLILKAYLEVIPWKHRLSHPPSK